MRIAGLTPSAAISLPRTTAEPQLLAFDPGVGIEPRADAAEALSFVPEADRALLARAGVRIEVQDLEQLPEDPAAPSGATSAIVGATKIGQRPDGSWMPSLIRIAARPIDGSTMHEVLFHEVGHAVSVLRRQDTSERAAQEYIDARFEDVFAADHAELAEPTAPPQRSAPALDAAAGAAQARSGGGQGALAAGAAIALLALAFLAL